MNKNDRLIVVIGVVILLIASIGIYLWVPNEVDAKVADGNEFFDFSGVSSYIPESITVSSSSPFYPLIATPLAVHYNHEGDQVINPLYVKNFTDASSSIQRVQYQLHLRDDDLIVDTSESPKQVSLSIASEFWDSSEAALLMQDNESGYTLGVIATPLASYLNIPVIVTDTIDQEVINCLSELGVTHTLVCGDTLEGYGTVKRFHTVEDIVNMTIDLLRYKFGDIDYVTVTNPIDAWPPKVLDQEKFYFGPETLKSTASTYIGQALFDGSGEIIGTFTIPKDYKYALIKFTGYNLDYEDVDELGDQVEFRVGPMLEDIPAQLQEYELFVGSTSAGGIAERDSQGNVIEDKVYFESVVYDRGGVEYKIRASGKWLVKREGRVQVEVIVQKLEDPVYPMMKGLSTLSPYLTAYHKGVLFGKPEFAFTADDDVIADDGTTCPGFYLPRRNPKLTQRANEHIYDTIHHPLNVLLAQLADIDVNLENCNRLEEKDIETLQSYYASQPVYIALVGGATVLPQMIYQNYMEPVGVEETHYYFGAGTPSDVIYGNIDPIYYDWSNMANDVFTTYPFQENIIGRLSGWDAQDLSALLVRTIFYEEIIDKMGEWKDTFGLLMGGGCDFQKPLIRYLIFGDLLGIVPRDEPMKYDTGYSEFQGKKIAEDVAKPMGFTVEEAWVEEAASKGFSDDALSRIKWDTNIVNKLFFSQRQIKQIIGDSVVKGGDIMENSNFIYASGHGNQHLFGMSGNELVAAGFGGPVIHAFLQQFIPILGGFLGPGFSLSEVGTYSTRELATIEFGPSFMWLESCICGKIDGMYPTGSVGQTLLHSGVNSLVASSAGSNIGGGYLEPKVRKYDTPLSVWRAYRQATRDARNGDYPDVHFGNKIFSDICENLQEDDVSVGLAFRNAKNKYLPEDADWELWWAPPLVTTGSAQLDNLLYQGYSDTMQEMFGNSKSPMLENKYISFQEYLLFGDPAFNPYEPINDG